ncbi:MAG: trimethylamine methyltransferase family protein [Candidatus Bipolaricaulia bacterium]
MRMQPVEILSDSEADEIHDTAKRVLCEVGLEIKSERGRLLLEDAGATVDHDSEQVKFTDHLIEDCIESAPEKVIYGGRNKDQERKITPQSSLYAHPPGGASSFVGSDPNSFREPTTQDVLKWIRLSDALEEIDACTALYPTDVQDKTRDIYITQLLLQNTEKHIHVSPYSKKNMEFIIKSVLRVQDEEELRQRPLVSVVASSLSPLRYSANAFEVLSIAGSYGIPVEMATNPIAGTTSPVTLSGVVMLAHAELLGAIVLSQLANPGAPLIAFPLPSHLDMKTSNLQEGKIENAMMTMALIQVIHKNCEIPFNASGLVTDSLHPDGQSIQERTTNLMFSTMAGANVLTGAGQIEHYYAGSLAQLVVDNYLLKNARRALKGIEVNKDTMGLSAIKRNKSESNFLTDKHTLKYFEEEYIESNISCNLTRETWEEEGSKSLLQRAEEMVPQILREREEVELPEATVTELEEIMSEANSYDWEEIDAGIW